LKHGLILWLIETITATARAQKIPGQSNWSRGKQKAQARLRGLGLDAPVAVMKPLYQNGRRVFNHVSFLFWGVRDFALYVPSDNIYPNESFARLAGKADWMRKNRPKVM